MTSLQHQYAAESICFGCGPANDKGLRIESFVDGDRYVCDWTPESHHEAFPGMLNGGIIGALLDCHANWTAAHHLMLKAGQDRVECTVTGEFTVKLKAPTPSNGPVHLTAWVTESSGRKAHVEATLEAGGQVTATCTGIFIQVKEGHPAYHRW